MAKKIIDKKVEQEVKKTDSGIYVVENTEKTREPYYVVENAKDEYKVVNQYGEMMRMYVKGPGCDDPKESAEMYAKKLSSQFK